MPRFAANLSFLYQEHPFIDRFAAAAQDGFKAVEYLFPYAFDAKQLAARLRENNLTQVLFNAPPGDWETGERGIAALPGREEEFRSGLAQALAYADILGNKLIHVMAGLRSSSHTLEDQQNTYIANLRYAAAEAAKHGRSILIEPINPRDMPGYVLSRQEEARAIVAAIGSPNLLVQMDLYHAQIVEGNLEHTLRRWGATIGHVQVASVPDRHEPDHGELNFPYLFQLLDDLEYSGWVGCEYRPEHDTSAGLGWKDQWM